MGIVINIQRRISPPVAPEKAIFAQKFDPK